MSEIARASGYGGACESCLRRSWLLAELSAVLDRNCRADGRLFELLALEDHELIAALGGRRRGELERRHAELCAPERVCKRGMEAICRHDGRYPSGLAHRGAPRLLYVTGGLSRFHRLTTRPPVTILGTQRATDYGIEMARGLARGLAAGGVPIVAERTAGIALAAQQGALEVDGLTIIVAGDGLDLPGAKSRSPTYERLAAKGCTVGELPWGARGRGWGVAAGVRIAAAIGALTVLVEADERPHELAGARIARELGKTVAALPGRVSSRASSGSHALLREGAHLVRDAVDVIDLLYDVEGSNSAPRVPTSTLPPLAPKQRKLLEQIGAGIDTPGALTAGREDHAQVLHALSELELLGVLSRGDGGRYEIRDTQPWRGIRYGVPGQMES